MTTTQSTITTCATCKQDIATRTGTGGTGYGTNKARERICYECCADADKAYMLEHGKISLYLTSKGITNWPGSLVFPTFPRIAKSRNNFGAERRDAWFVGPDRHVWHAVSIGWGENATCKRTKEVWKATGR